MKRLLGIALLFIFFCTLDARAALIWGTDATSELSGSRDASQLVTTGAWDCDFSISWNISQEDGYWVYKYCLEADKDPSHLILELTRDCNVALISQDNFEGPTVYEAGKHGLVEDIFGAKFEFAECNDFCIEFKTTRAPVYGNFFAKSGFDPCSNEWTIAYNVGLLGDGCSPYDFIVRPDGDGVIPTPEPATMCMLGIGLGALGVARRRKRNIG